MLLTMVVGGASLARFGLSESWGLIGEIRYWFFYILVLTYIPTLIFRRTWSQKAEYTTHASLVRLWVLLVIVLHGYIILTAFWTPNTENAIRLLLDILLLIALLLIALSVFSRSPEQSTYVLLKIFYVISLVVMIAGVPSFMSNKEEITFPGGGVIGFSRIVGAGVLISMYHAVKTNRIYWLLPIPAFILGVLFSGSRTAVLALAVVVPLFLLLLLFTPNVYNRKKVLFNSFLVLICIALLIPSPIIKEKLLSFWSSWWLPMSEPLTVESLYVADRDILFASALDLFREHVLFGAGLGAYEVQIGTDLYTYPHNLILNIASDGGIIGLILVGCSFCFLVFRWFRSILLEHTIAFCLGVFYLISSLFAGTYYDARFMWMFFLLFMMPASKIVRVPKRCLDKP